MNKRQRKKWTQGRARWQRRRHWIHFSVPSEDVGTLTAVYITPSGPAYAVYTDPDGVITKVYGRKA